MALDQIEYILFGVGVFIILLSLFLSYRLEKNRKQEKEISNSKILKAVDKLTDLIENRDTPEKLDELYQFIRYKFNIDELKTDIKAIRRNSQRKEAGFETLETEIGKIRESMEEVEESLGNLRALNLKELEEDLGLLVENTADNGESIGNLDERIAEISSGQEKLAGSLEELSKALAAKGEAAAAAARKKSAASEGEEKEDNIVRGTETGVTAVENNKEERENDKTPRGVNQEQESYIQEATIKGNPGSDKQKIYKRIKELKEAGMEFPEIADRVNMGVREVELFWKINTRG